jgi:hypothetical protein
MSPTDDPSVSLPPPAPRPTAFPVRVPAERFSLLEIHNTVLALEHRSRFLRQFLASINTEPRRSDAVRDLESCESARQKLTTQPL